MRLMFSNPACESRTAVVGLAILEVLQNSGSTASDITASGNSPTTAKRQKSRS